MNPRYRAGRRFEYRVRQDFESRGWWVIRAAGSHGPADLVCKKAGEPMILVQCKADSARHKKESIALAALAAHIDAEALLARRVGRKLVYEIPGGENIVATLYVGPRLEALEREP